MAVRILLVGAGGHGQVVADVLQAEARAGRDIELAGYVDDDPKLLGRTLVGGGVRGSIARRKESAYDALIVAIGDNTKRRSIFLELRGEGERFAAAAHPSAVLAQGVTVGVGTMVCAGAIVGVGTRLGSNTILNTGCSVDHHSTVADHVHVGPGARTGGGVCVGEGALIGMGALLLPGIVVGARAVVGAGAVVTRNVPPAALVVGIPARRMGIGTRGRWANEGDWDGR